MSVAGGLAWLWNKVRNGYTEAVFLLYLTVLFVTIYFGATTNLPPLIFLAGLLCIGCFNPIGKRAHAFWPVMGATGAVLILGFLRSDFVAMLASGKSLHDAWHLSTRYFRAPMIMWVTTWALVFAACGLTGRRAGRVLTWMTWLAIALFAVELVDAISNDGLRNWMNVHWFGHQRPEMVIVDASNLNTFLLMLFWPLAFWLVWRKWIGPILLMVVTVLWTAVTVDTNAQIFTLVAAAIVFWATANWPAAWSRRGILPERVLAGLAVFWVLAFPLVVLGVMRAGLTKPLHDHLPASWAARIDIWTYAVNRSLEKPWLGWGYESARRFDPYIPDHPHNLSLQAWLELGIPGLLLMALLWGCIFWFLAPKGSEAVEVPEAEGSLKALGGASEAKATPEHLAAQPSAQQLARPYVLAAAANYFLLNALSYGMWKQWLHCVAAMMLITIIFGIKAVGLEMKADNALPDKAIRKAG
ncbi:MAG TPA: O-antigen ligase family protein [Asticcacaulis sp.]|nr:O-antigen ligase family protein [Asticcacaulis sp.]